MESNLWSSVLRPQFVWLTVWCLCLLVAVCLRACPFVGCLLASAEQRSPPGLRQGSASSAGPPPVQRSQCRMVQRSQCRMQQCQCILLTGVQDSTHFTLTSTTSSVAFLHLTIRPLAPSRHRTFLWALEVDSPLPHSCFARPQAPASFTTLSFARPLAPASGPFRSCAP